MVSLNGTEVQAAYYGLADCIRNRKVTGHPYPKEVADLYWRLHTTLYALSRGRQEAVAGEGDPSRLEQKWLGSAEVAERLGCSKRTVERYVEAGKLSAQTNGGRLFFREADIDDYIIERTR